mgnify:CR=1 FL=1
MKKIEKLIYSGSAATYSIAVVILAIAALGALAT